jgi:hypothetical protein
MNLQVADIKETMPPKIELVGLNSGSELLVTAMGYEIDQV